MPILHSLCSDKLIHNANLKFCHVKVLMMYKFTGKFKKNLQILNLQLIQTRGCVAPSD